MKFKDLPIGTKFTDELQLNYSYFQYYTKTGDRSYCYENLDTIIHEWPGPYDDEIYPILEFLDD